MSLQLSTLWDMDILSLCSLATSSPWTSLCWPAVPVLQGLSVGDMTVDSALPPWTSCSFSLGVWFITMNLYFFQLRAFASWGCSAGCLRLIVAFLLLLDSVGEFGWQSDLSGLWGLQMTPLLKPRDSLKQLVCGCWMLSSSMGAAEPWRFSCAPTGRVILVGKLWWGGTRWEIMVVESLWAVLVFATCEHRVRDKAPPLWRRSMLWEPSSFPAETWRSP